MTQLSLPELPTEILDQILGLFCAHCREKDNKQWDALPLTKYKIRQRPDEPSWYGVDRYALRSLCLTSKRLRELAERVLYHEFALGCGDSGLSLKYRWERRFASFMRTIAARRELALMVESVFIHEELLNGLWTYAVLDDEMLSLRRVLIDVAASMGLPLMDTWTRRATMFIETDPRIWGDSFQKFVKSFLDVSAPPVMREEHIEVHYSSGHKRWIATEILVVVLACLPNMRHLGISSSDDFVTHGSHWSAFKSLGVSQLPVKRYDFRDMSLSILRLTPELEELNVVDAKIREFADLPKLKTLRISEGYFDERDLARLLEVCTGGLETFAYEAKDKRFTRDTEHHQPSFAVRLLQNHKASLKHIHYDVCLQSNMAPLEQDATFADFPVLDSLLISSDLVPKPGTATDPDALARLLPPSLQKLCIVGDCSEETKAALLGLAARMKRDPAACPKLELVTAAVQTGEREEEEELKTVFGLVNVEFGTECCSLRAASDFCVELPREVVSRTPRPLYDAQAIAQFRRLGRT